MASDNTETINNLLDVILSNGFPRLRICKAYGMGAVTFSKTWTGSTTLQILNLTMKIENDYEQLRSVYPHLHQFTKEEYPVYILATVSSGLKNRISRELQTLRRLEIENKFILNDDPMMLSHGDIKPARYNRTKPIQRSRDNSRSVIQGRIFRTSEPYCRASFLIEITLTRGYPLIRPSVIFLDPIYHPNVWKTGEFYCCPHRLYADILGCDYLGCRYGKSKLTATFADLIEDMIRIIDRPPIIDLSVNADCAEEYFHNYQVFYEKALQLTLSYGRPLY